MLSIPAAEAGNFSNLFSHLYFGEGLSTTVQGFSGGPSCYIILYHVLPSPPLSSCHLPVPQTGAAFPEDAETWGKMGEGNL